MQQDKLTLIEYTLYRNVAILIICFVLLRLKNIDPIQDLPNDKSMMMYARALLGLLISIAVNTSILLIPFSVMVILFQTNPFFTSILSYFVNREPIIPVELLGMVVCFISVILIVSVEPE